jgi:hypothetical protein
MAKSQTFELECPCCGAKLKVDPVLKVVLSHEAKAAPKTIEDIGAGLEKLKGAEQRREDAFNKSFQQMKSSKDVLSAKFDELLKKAQSDDPSKPPPKPLGLE